MKNKANRIQDKLRLIGFLRDFGSDGLQKSKFRSCLGLYRFKRGEAQSGGNASPSQAHDKAWMMEELHTISSPTEEVMEELISRRKHTTRSLRERGFIDMDDLKCQHKVTMEMEWVCSKILDMKKRVSWPSQMAFPNQPKPWSVDLLKVEEENIKIRKMSLDGVHEVGRCGRYDRECWFKGY